MAAPQKRRNGLAVSGTAEQVQHRSKGAIGRGRIVASTIAHEGVLGVVETDVVRHARVIEGAVDLETSPCGMWIARSHTRRSDPRISSRSQG